MCGSFGFVAVQWTMAVAASSSCSVASRGVRSWAARTKIRYRSALTAIAHFGKGVLQPPLGEVLGDFLATKVVTGLSRSTFQGYVSATRAAEDLEFIPPCIQQIHCPVAKSGRTTPGQPYVGPKGLAALWEGADNPQL